MESAETRSPRSDMYRSEILRNSQVGSKNFLVTQVTNIEQELFMVPWQGARFLFVCNDTMVKICYDAKISSLKDIQILASDYREMKVSLVNCTASCCVINVNAIPKMQGYIGYIFGYQGVLSIIEDYNGLEFRQLHYDDSDGLPDSCPYDGSAMQSEWEDKIKEPFEDYIVKLFTTESQY